MLKSTVKIYLCSIFCVYY